MARLLRVVGYILLACLLGAILGFSFLSRTSGSLIPDALLRRYGIDPELTYLFWFPVVAGGGPGAILGLIYGLIQDFRETRSAEAEDALRQLVAQTVRAETQAPPPPPCLGLAENATEFFRGSHSVEVRSQSPAPVKDIRFTVAELAISHEHEHDGRAEIRTELQTVAFYESSELRFPGFSLSPRGFLQNLFARTLGAEDIRFPAQEEFSRAYLLSASIPENTRRLFDYAPLLGALARRPGLHIASQVNALIIYQDGTAFHGATLEGFIKEAAEILRLFEQAARNASTDAANSPTPKADARALADGARGAMGAAAQANLVTHADVDAFLRMPAPRPIPAGFRRYPDRLAPAYFVVLGSVFVLTGAFFGLTNLGELLSGATNKAAGVALGLIFMLMGGSVAYFFGRIRARCKQLLRDGRVASGQIQSIEETSMALGSSNVFEVTVIYPSEAGSKRGTCNIVGLASLRRARTLADNKKPARVLYDPAHPERVLLAEALLTVSEELEP